MLTTVVMALAVVAASPQPVAFDASQVASRYRHLEKLPTAGRTVWLFANQVALAEVFGPKSLGELCTVTFELADDVDPHLRIFIDARPATVRDILIALAEHYGLTYEVLSESRVRVHHRQASGRP